MNSNRPSSRLLRRALQGNALFSGLSGLGSFAAAPVLAGFLGAFETLQLRTLGAQLTLFAVWLVWLSLRSSIPRWQVALVLTLDAAWVAGSVMLLLSPPPSLTPGGGWVVAIVAGVVAVFATLQLLGLLRLRPGAPARVGGDGIVRKAQPNRSAP